MLILDLFDSGDIIINRLVVESNRILEKANNVIKLEDDSEKEVADFANDFSKTYFDFLSIAEKYHKNAETLITQISAELDILTPNTAKWDNTNLRAVQYESGKLKLHRALAEFVVKVSEQISGIGGENRRTLMKNINDMLISLRSVIDYRDINATTILSDCSYYPNLWHLAAINILSMEMSAKFAYLHRVRRDAIDNMKNLSEADNIAMLSKIARQYNGFFGQYALAAEQAAGLKIVLVNNYVKYLASMINLGSMTDRIINDSSNGNWKICSNFLQGLMADNMVDEATKAEWITLSSIMKRIIVEK